MATNFTSSIPNFSPYVQQIPVEAYANVEAFKQSRYDQGVERINSTLGSLSDLPILKTETQQYVQGRLGELKTQLQKVAGSDFSNQQLVNQIQGLSGKIAKDPIVQNGLISTANIRKVQGQIDSAKKEGKSSIENEWYANKQIQGYLNDGKADSSFNGSYNPYVDVQKKWMDVVKSLGEDSDVSDIPFEMDANGNPNFEKFATAMQRRGIEGKSAAKISNALRASLTNEDLNQLQISGAYRFKDTTPEQLNEQAFQSYNKQYNVYSQELEEKQKQLLSATNDGKLSDKVRSDIDAIKNLLGDPDKNIKGILQENYDTQSQLAQNNPEALRGELYKNGYIEQFAAGFSNQKTKTEFVESPFTKQQNWIKGYNLDLQKDNRAEREFTYKQGQDQIDNTFKAKELELKINEAGAGQTPFVVNEGTATSDINALKEFSSQTTGVVNEIDALKGTYAQKTGANLGEIDKQIAAYQNGTYKPPTAAKDLFDQIIEKQNTVQTRAELLQQERKKAEGAVYNNEISSSEILAKSAPLNVNTPDGRITFSAKEVSDYLKKEKSVDTYIATPGAGGVKTNVTSIDTKSLTPRELQLYNIVKNKYTPNKRTGDKFIDGYLGHINEIGAVHEQQENKVNQVLAQNLSSRLSKFVPQATTIPLSEKTRPTKLGNVATLLNGIQVDKGGNEDLDLDKAREMVSGKGTSNTKMDLTVVGDKYQLTLSNGTETQTIKNLTQQQAASLSNNSPLVFQNTKLASTLDLGNGNTNLTGDPLRSYFQKNNTTFTNISKLNVKADIQRDMLDPSKLRTVFYLRTPEGWKTTEMPQQSTSNGELTLGSEEQIRTFLNSLTDKQVYDLFKQNHANFKDFNY